MFETVHAKRLAVPTLMLVCGDKEFAEKNWIKSLTLKNIERVLKFSWITHDSTQGTAHDNFLAQLESGKLTSSRRFVRRRLQG